MKNSKNVFLCTVLWVKKKLSIIYSKTLIIRFDNTYSLFLATV